MAENKLLDQQPEVKYYDVVRVVYETHYSRQKIDKPPTLQITYVREGGFCREWVCPEHKGFAREKFESWWKWKSVIAPPKETETAARYANAGALAAPTKIKVARAPGGAFPQIEWVEFSSIPNFKPVQAIRKKDWSIGKPAEGGLRSEPSPTPDSPCGANRIDEPPKRCGQCKRWTPALVMSGGELEEGGFCSYAEQRVPSYDIACCKFEKNENDYDVPF